MTASTGDADGPSSASRHARRAEAFGLASLFAAGLLHWVFLFSPVSDPLRGPSFVVEDWPKEHRYVSILQQAVWEVRLPLYISRPIHTRKFLALPETLWSPQVILLRWMAPGPFLLLNTVILYSAGFLGCLLLRRRQGLSFVPFSLLFLLFAFNGHITAHLAVGHSMWAGYFLLPFFVVLVLELAEGRPGGTVPLRLALVLFAIALQGAFHVLVWCLLFLGLLAVLHPPSLRAACRTVAWTLALTACRLVPAFFLMNRKDQAFISGFPSLLDLGRALVTIQSATEPLRGGSFGALRWWEYDTYVGAAALAWVAWYGLGPGRWRAGRSWHPLEGPMIVMALLSLGDLYAAVNALPVPIVNAERVSSRFLMVPLLCLVVLCAERAQRHLKGAKAGWRWLQAGVAMATAASLAAHSWEWRLPHLETTLPARFSNLEIAIATQPEVLHRARETAYEASVVLAALVTLAALAALAVRILRLRRRDHARL